MLITAQISAIRETEWYEYLIRFVFGGLITVVAGLIASKFGPVVGGLFLAFPAIFPASATLIEKHERKRKEKLGLNGRRRGRNATSLDAAGAAIGSIGLLVFGVLVWIGLARFTPGLVLAIATIAWFVVSAVFWIIRKRV
jgi:hypothetical protein